MLEDLPRHGLLGAVFNLAPQRCNNGKHFYLSDQSH